MIKLSGILEYSMGGFLCLRGYASFKMLSGISEPNTEVQRTLIEHHKEEISQFLNEGEYRFFPEIILSIALTNGKSNFDVLENFHNALQSGKTWNDYVGKVHFSMSQNTTKNILNQYSPLPKIDRLNITHIKFDDALYKLNRIDGNHRLSVSNDVLTDLVVPYCLILFRNPEEEQQYSRAVFHNINAKQIPLNLEENLKVILGSPEVFSDEKLKNDPSFGWRYYLARKIINSIDFSYFSSINSYISDTKHVFFVELFDFLIKNNSLEEKEESIDKLKRQLVDIEQSLIESEIIATTSNIAVIGALAYYKLTNDFKYRGFLSWIKKNNIGKVDKLRIADVIRLYDEIFEHVPRKMFLARWYPAKTDPDYKKAENRLKAIKEVAKELNLELVDLGTRVTGTFDIRKVMYDNIRECDIFLADLSGARHNVMIEVGYALKHVGTGRMIFYFQETAKEKQVPFDVNHLSYDLIEDSDDIRTKTKERIITILEQAKTSTI